MKQLWTSGELAKILGKSDRALQMQATKEEWPYMDFRVRGGKQRRYSYWLLPDLIKAAIQAQQPQEPLAIQIPGVSKNAVAEAGRRLAALHAVSELSREVGVTRARDLVASQTGESAVTLYRWDRLVEGRPESEHLKCLVPKVDPAIVPADQARPENLKTWQREVMDARLAILCEVDRLAEANGVNKAVAHIIGLAKTGNLDPTVQALVPVANARSGGKKGSRHLSRTSIFRWRKLAQKGLAALAPKAVEKPEMPVWVPVFLNHYRKPQKPSVRQAMEEMAANLPDGMKMPTESQVRRAIKKFSRTDIQAGRMTGSNLRSVKGFIRRETSGLLPLDVVVCDGHSFKARVAHPTHGRPFHPEVCAVIDVKTRVLLGWSAGLSESAQTVADALRHAITTTPEKPYGGIPAIFYTDKGSGNMAHVLTDPVTGILSRMSIHHEVGKPDNPQGRGLVEKPNTSIWIAAAKKLPTCTHKDMDSKIARRVYLQTNKDVKEMGRSDLLPTWPQFLDYCQQTADAHNNRPHSALPKITDPETGRRRHMKPLEAYAMHMAEGWRPVLATEAELTDLFRPCVMRTCRRCEVSDPAGNKFYSKDLEHYHGMRVFVHYDVHDPSQVWVRDDEGRLICIARFEANKRHFFPLSVIEQKRNERAAGRRKLKEQQIQEIEDERRGLIDVTPEPIPITQAQEESARQVIEIAQKRTLKPAPANDWDVYMWLLDEKREGHALTVQETQWIEDYEHFTETGKKRGLFKSGFQPYAERRKQEAM